MLEFKIDGKPYRMPEADDMSFDIFEKFVTLKSDKDKIELLTGADLSTLPATPQVEKQIAGLISLIDGLTEDVVSYLENPMQSPEKITITVMDKKITYTKDLGKLAYWPMTKIKTMIKEMGKEPFNKYAHYRSFVGHYLYQKVTGNVYNEYMAEEFCKDVIGPMPFKQVLALGDFFLFIQRHLWLQKRDCLTVKRQLRKSLRGSMFSISMAN